MFLLIRINIRYPGYWAPPWTNQVRRGSCQGTSHLGWCNLCKRRANPVRWVPTRYLPPNVCYAQQWSSTWPLAPKCSLSRGTASATLHIAPLHSQMETCGEHQTNPTSSPSAAKGSYAADAKRSRRSLAATLILENTCGDQKKRSFNADMPKKNYIWKKQKL